MDEPIISPCRLLVFAARNQSGFRRLAWGFLLVLSLQSNCGYRVALKNRTSPAISTVAVVPLENETTSFQAEQILTRALVRALVETSPYQVVNDPGQADALLEGAILSLSAKAVIFGQKTFGSTFLVTLRARVELRERETGKILLKNNDYLFREQYVINVDVQNFFSELNPAYERIAQDFAASVVSFLLEGF